MVVDAAPRRRAPRLVCCETLTDPRLSRVHYEQQCPRCGAEFSGDSKDEVADSVLAHAETHGHALDRNTVLAHLEGIHPHERESD